MRWRQAARSSAPSTSDRKIKKCGGIRETVIFVVACISSTVMAVCLLTRGPLLRLIFGSVEADVMEAAQIYFFYTALSFPFIALYDAGSSIYRAQKYKASDDDRGRL